MGKEELEEIAKRKMQIIAQKVKEELPNGFGFVVLAFEFNAVPNTAQMMYVSNANRNDVEKAMEEWIYNLIYLIYLKFMKCQKNKIKWRVIQMIYEFEMLGDVVGKARPRMNTRTGRAYTPTNTKNYEYFLRQWFIREYPNFTTIESRVKVTIIAYFGIPKSTSKKKEAEMLANIISPTKKPDADNIVKIVLDAMNKFAFKDDTQVTKLEIEKKYSRTPRIYVKIEEY